MVLLPKPVSITQQKLESAAQAMGLTNLSVTAQEGQDGAFVVFFNGMPFIIMSIDQPVPHETFNGVLQFSFGLENGKQIVERQKAHVIISPMADVQHMGQGIMSGVGVMVMTDIISRIIKPVGHYWSHADTLVSQSQFEKGLQGVQQAMAIQNSGQNNAGSHLPHMLWVGFRLLGSSEPGKIGARTIGLECFTGYELEVSPVALPPEVLAQRIYGMIEYLFNNGPVLQDGHTLGISETEHFRIKAIERVNEIPPRFLLTLEQAGA